MPDDSAYTRPAFISRSDAFPSLVFLPHSSCNYDRSVPSTHSPLSAEMRLQCYCCHYWQYSSAYSLSISLFLLSISLSLRSVYLPLSTVCLSPSLYGLSISLAMHPSLYLPTHLPTCQSIHPFIIIYLSIYSVYSIYLSIYLSIYCSVALSLYHYISIYCSIPLSLDPLFHRAYLPAWLSVCLSLSLSLHQAIALPTYLSIRHSLHPSSALYIATISIYPALFPSLHPSTK